MPGESGDAEWLRGLYDRNRDVVFRYAASRVGRDAAMDVVSDTFIEANRCRASFDPNGNVLETRIVLGGADSPAIWFTSDALELRTAAAMAKAKGKGR